MKPERLAYIFMMTRAELRDLIYDVLRREGMDVPRSVCGYVAEDVLIAIAEKSPDEWAKRGIVR